ncbi:hypothetical protein GCM10027056_20340 [Glaciibacter psychrotolerans]
MISVARLMVCDIRALYMHNEVQHVQLEETEWNVAISATYATVYADVANWV